MRRCAHRSWRRWIALLLDLMMTACVGAEARDGLPVSAGIASDASPDDEPAEEADASEESGADTGDARLDIGGGGSPQECRPDLDIVFVMDVTTSMGEFIETLADNLGTVDAAARDLGVSPRYGLIVFADDFALLEAGQAYADLASLEAEFRTWIAFTHQDGQIDGGELNESFPENSLDALHATTGFAWRPADATTRIAIHMTDDTFWAGPGVFNGEHVEHDYAQTVAALQDEQIRVYAFAARKGGNCECKDVEPGWFRPYDGQPSIPDATDGGVFDILRVLHGELDLGVVIPEAVADSICTPYDPAG